MTLKTVAPILHVRSGHKIPLAFGLILRGAGVAVLLASAANAQTVLGWQQLRARFQANNPDLLAGALNISESRAQEITAYLRPNPDITATLDQITPFTAHPYAPFAQALPYGAISYLHERKHKRELRRDSAVAATKVASYDQLDLERTLLYTLRSAYIQTLQAKAVLANATENLEYYDRELDINRTRLKAGDLAKVDETRLELQRIQFESDLQNAKVNLRTAKIQLVQLLNETLPVDSFDVVGQFDFQQSYPTLASVRQDALETRPDLLSAQASVSKADVDHRLAIANASTDPTFTFDLGRNPPIAAYVGFSVNFPLRIFDRNQGEKIRTDLEITRTERLVESSKAKVFSDVDSAYATLESTVTLLKPYKEKYLSEATEVRDTVSYAYQRGAATLIDYLDAQKSYRDVQLNYIQLVGTYLTTAGQLNLAVGREVIP